MASKVDICNHALIRLGVRQISSLDENNREAQECGAIFDLARDTVLQMHPWNFARARRNLSLLSSTMSGWTYAYSYPVDCLHVLEISSAASSLSYISDVYVNGVLVPGQVSRQEKIPYEVASDSTNNRNVILTNSPDAELIYTRRVTDPNSYSAMFIDSLAWKLAATLALPLRGDGQLANFMAQQFDMSVRSARCEDSREGESDNNQVSSYEAARM